MKKRLSAKDKIIIKHFIKFLRNRDALVPFCCNLVLDWQRKFFVRIYHNGSLSGYLQYMFFKDCRTPREYVIAGFTWGRSKEGIEYWIKISNSWRIYYDTILTPWIMQETVKPTMVKIEVKWQNDTTQIYRITGRNVEQVRERLLAKIGGTKLPYGVRKQILERFYAVKK